MFGLVTMLAAGLTAFYMSRLFFMTFHGRKRWASDAHPHEAPLLMTVPMVVLAIGSVAIGGLLYLVGFQTWLEPVTGHAEHHEPVLPVPVITGLTLALVAIGAFLAWRQYHLSDVGAPSRSLPARAARADLYQEVVNASAFERPGLYLTRSLVYVDRAGIDGAVNGGARLTSRLGGWFAKRQNGFVRSYASSMLVGVVVLLGAVLVVR